MPRQLVLYIAVSLDGFIARTDGSVDWLSGNSGNSDVDYGFGEFFAGIDTILMGRKTYEQLIDETFTDHWPYEGKTCYVASRTENKPDERVEFIRGDLVHFIRGLLEQPGLDIWLMGGAELIEPFVRENLVDRYIITVIPTILGQGIPLFRGSNPEIKLRFSGSRHTDGMMELRYERRRSDE